MSEAYDRAEIVRLWVEKAEHDITNANHTLTLQSNCPFDTVCFHAQQCAEKYLKALLAHLGSKVPRIHDLTELLPLVRNCGEVDIDHRDAELLTPCSVESRYPTVCEPITRADAEEAIVAARRVRAAVRAVLPRESLERP
jgi:HEPN domain-containing protein